MTAAYELTKRGMRPVVYEKMDKVGGIARTEFCDGYYFDMGGHRFFTKKAELDRFLHDLMVDELIDVDRSSKIYFLGKYFNYPPTMMNAFKGLGIEMSARILLTSYWKCFCAMVLIILTPHLVTGMQSCVSVAG